MVLQRSSAFGLLQNAVSPTLPQLLPLNLVNYLVGLRIVHCLLTYCSESNVKSIKQEDQDDLSGQTLKTNLF